MTRKDYQLIANVITNLDEVIDPIAFEVLVENMAEALQADNPRFDSKRFASACGANKIRRLLDEAFSN